MENFIRLAKKAVEKAGEFSKGKVKDSYIGWSYSVWKSKGHGMLLHNA